MPTNIGFAGRILMGLSAISLFVGGLAFVAFSAGDTQAGEWPFRFNKKNRECPPSAIDETASPSDFGGSWHWVRSPDEEKRHVVGLFNRYCIRCHGVDGRGIWDIPDVPNFTNSRWQQSRSDGQLARIIIEGRGACMPPFRGAITLEESWAIARYLRTFVPGTEVSRPDLGHPEISPEKAKSPKQ